MAHPTPIRGLGPDSRRAEAARRLLAGRLADARRQEDTLAEGFTEEGVHDMRVAVRRLRAALKLFRDLGDLEALERQVKRLQDALGDVRDLHVQSSWLGAAEQQEKGRRRQGLLALRERLESQRGIRESRLKRALSHWRRKTVPALLHETERLKGPGRYGGKRVRKQLRQRLRKVEQRLEAYLRAPDGLIAHELRKEAKKLRYEAEVFRPAFRRRMDALLEALVPLQELLGELHDADVRTALLERFASEGTTPERAAALRLLEDVREQRAGCSARTSRELHRWHAEALPRALRKLVD